MITRPTDLSVVGTSCDTEVLVVCNYVQQPSRIDYNMARGVEVVLTVDYSNFQLCNTHWRQQ